MTPGKGEWALPLKEKNKDTQVNHRMHWSYYFINRFKIMQIHKKNQVWNYSSCNSPHPPLNKHLLSSCPPTYRNIGVYDIKNDFPVRRIFQFLIVFHEYYVKTFFINHFEYRLSIKLIYAFTKDANPFLCISPNVPVSKSRLQYIHVFYHDNCLLSDP